MKPTDARVPLGKMRTEAELDQAVRDVEALKVAGAIALYQLGHRIAQIQDDGTWKLRTVKNATTGKVAVKWHSFEQFAEGELKLSRTHAIKLAKISREYRESDVRLFGMKNCALILEAPREERPRLEQAAAAGASTRVIEKAVRKANASGTRATVARTAKATQAAKTKSTSQIAIAKITGTETIKLIRRPARIGGDNSDAPRAKKLSDEPYGVLQLATDVTMHFFVSSDARGSLLLKVKTIRDEPDEPSRSKPEKQPTPKTEKASTSKTEKASTIPTTKAEPDAPNLSDVDATALAPQARKSAETHDPEKLESSAVAPVIATPVIPRARSQSGRVTSPSRVPS